MHRVIVQSKDSGMRLDKYLFRYFDRTPRSFVYKNLRKKNIKLKESRARGDEILSAGDEIELFFSAETLASLSTAYADSGVSRTPGVCSDTPTFRGSLRSGCVFGDAYPPTLHVTEATPTPREAVAFRHPEARLGDYCDIVYEDEDIIIADKRAGVLSQKARRDDISLNEVLRMYVSEAARDPQLPEDGVSTPARSDGCPEVGVSSSRLPEDGPSLYKPSVVHRLDRNTSGLIIFAKTYRAAEEIGRLFRSDAVEKYYLALSMGLFNEAGGAVEGWLTKDTGSNTVHVSEHETPGAAKAGIDYEVLGAGRDKRISLVKIRLKGGKSHEIRTLLGSIGHPVMGDTKYGGTGSGDRHLMLHAYELRIPEESDGTPRHISAGTYRAAPPGYFIEALKDAGMDEGILNIPELG